MFSALAEGNITLTPVCAVSHGSSLIYFRRFSIDRGTQRQFLENICSEDDLRPRIFGTFVVKFLAYMPLLGFSNLPNMV